MDPSKTKRGALQPRGDLQNRSPEDEDDASYDEQLQLKKSSLPPSMKSKINTTTGKKSAKYLPVKSSGYGRASPSVKILNASNGRPKLRHGDGSLAGELSFDSKKKSRRSSTSRPSLAAAHATKPNNKVNNVNSRLRSASPVVKGIIHGKCPSPTVRNTQQEELQQLCQRELNQNKRQHVDDNDKNNVMPVKKFKNQEVSKSEGENHISFNSFASPESSSNNHFVMKKYHDADIDPTPVKAAKKLLLDAKKRPVVIHHAPLSPLMHSPVMEEETVECAVAMKDSDPLVLALSVQQQSADNDNLALPTDSDNNNIASIFTELHPSISQSQSLSGNLFSIQSGIASTTIRSLIKNKQTKSNSSTAVVVDRSTSISELRKRLERKEEELKTLKVVCNDLLQGKDEFVSGAVDIELTLRQKVMSVQTAFVQLGEERDSLMKQLNDVDDTAQEMQEKLACLEKERDLAIDRCNTVQEECAGVKSDLETLQQYYTDGCAKIALLETEVEESKSKLDEAHSQVIEAQSSTEKAVDDIKVGMSLEINMLKEKNETLVAMMKAREMEVCKMMNVDFKDGSSFLDAVRSKVEEFQNDARTINESQNELERLKAELKQSKSDLGVALERAATKDKDMSELMKSIGDIQRMAQDREEEVHQLRQFAEDRALESEKKVVSLIAEKQSLEKAMEDTKAGFEARESNVQDLLQQLSESKIESTQLASQLQLERDLRSRSEEKEKEEHNERVALSAQMLTISTEHGRKESQIRDKMEKIEFSWSEKHAAAVRESAEKDERLQKCREEITSLIAKQESLKQALSEQKTALEASNEAENRRLKDEITVLQERLQSEVNRLQSDGIVSAQRVRELEDTIRKSEVERKRMHDIIQELRGNVRVFARIRPFLPNEIGNNIPFVNPSGETTLQVMRGKQQSNFQFDRVFAPSAGQEAVFGEVSEFVQSALDGYNVCLFSYGQTGSGKTHTMQGSGSDRGLIPRSIEQIGIHKKKLEQDGWEFVMDVSFLEIYNEAIRDLLRDSKSSESKHDIKVDSDGRRSVTNLTVKRIDPTDADCCDALL